MLKSLFLICEAEFSGGRVNPGFVVLSFIPPQRKKFAQMNSCCELTPSDTNRVIKQAAAGAWFYFHSVVY